MMGNDEKMTKKSLSNQYTQVDQHNGHSVFITVGHFSPTKIWVQGEDHFIRYNTS